MHIDYAYIWLTFFSVLSIGKHNLGGGRGFRDAYKNIKEGGGGSGACPPFLLPPLINLSKDDFIRTREIEPNFPYQTLIPQTCRKLTFKIWKGVKL